MKVGDPVEIDFKNANATIVGVLMSQQPTMLRFTLFGHLLENLLENMPIFLFL